MPENDALDKVLFEDGQGDLINFKFLLGDKRNITREELRSEAAKAVTQIKSGKVKPVASLDSHLPTVSIEEFLASAG